MDCGVSYSGQYIAKFTFWPAMSLRRPYDALISISVQSPYGGRTISYGFTGAVGSPKPLLFCLNLNYTKK